MSAIWAKNMSGVKIPISIVCGIIGLFAVLAGSPVRAEQDKRCTGIHNHSKCALEQLLRCLQQSPHEVCTKNAQLTMRAPPPGFGRLKRFDTSGVDTADDQRGSIVHSPQPEILAKRAVVREYYCRSDDRLCAATLTIATTYLMAWDDTADRWRVIARDFAPPYGDFPWRKFRRLVESEKSDFCTSPASSPTCATVGLLRCRLYGDCYDYVHHRRYRLENPKALPGSVEYRIVDGYELVAAYVDLFPAWQLTAGNWLVSVQFRVCGGSQSAPACEKVKWMNVEAIKWADNEWSPFEWRATR